MDQALSDVKVLDLTWHVTGPYCTKLLADYGAAVIKVERPGEGDPTRKMGPFPGDLPHPEKGGLFLYLNTNKQGITLNLKSPIGRRIVKELVLEADILVENFKPGVMARLGLDYETLSQINPRLVMTSISNFGQTGPYRDYKATDMIEYALGGPMYSTGDVDFEPLKVHHQAVQFQAGVCASVATMTALFGAEIRGEGEVVDISIMETQAAGIDRTPTLRIAYQYTGDVNGRQPTIPGFASGTFPCKDGYVTLMGGTIFFPKTAAMLEMPELLKHPVYSNIFEHAKPEVAEEFLEILLPWLLERTRREIWQAAQAQGLLSSPVYTTEDLLADPHYTERQFFAEVEHPLAGICKVPGAPFKMSETPWQVIKPAPLLGQHNEEILGNLGYNKEDLVKLQQQGII
ncbi:MAG: CoA transferase [Deltaproteobacteria bacterium]|nr:CoA transferase [Deltaproteobacteria bacterium]